jgi:protein tyrosine phosphatase
MIWQENVQTIVMVTNLEEQGEELCSCYWPALQEDTEYGSVAVMFKEELVLSEVTKRVFQVKHCEEGESKSRVVTQFQFTGWSCDDVPLYAFSFLNFVLRIRTYHDGLEMKHPILVHCSDGAGQTGTFIASDYTIQKLNKERKVDIFELIKELRLQRTSLVETKEQYIFCHDFALVFMLCGNTSIPVNQLGDYILRLHEADPLTENTGFDTHFKLLDRLTPHDESTNGTFAATAAVRGYRQKHEYITTQVPNESTAEDFWNLVWDQNFKFIITLTHLEGSEEETSLQYWPSKETSEYDSVLITLQEEEKMEEYAVRKFNLTSKQSSTERVITQFIYLAWSDGKVPETCSQLLEMINRIESEQQQVDNKSLVVTCSDGVHKSGLFCAMSIIVDALKTEHVVDVFKTILALRLHNPDFVSNQEEYRFCYDLALKCVNSLRTQAV